MPMLVERYQLSPHAPAPGKWRGGVGIDMQFQVFTPSAILTARGMERYQFRPWGRKGGHAGTLGETFLEPGTSAERSIGKIVSHLELQPYQVVRIITPNGGGYGDPLERDPQLVLRDVEDGFVDVEGAARDYGVRIESGAVDAAGTSALRRKMAANRPAASEFSYGAEREQFEAAFPNALQDELERLLRQYPAVQRQFWKGRFWRALLAHVEKGGKVADVRADKVLAQCRDALARRKAA
jgi:N-methylhydantoinase B